MDSLVVPVWIRYVAGWTRSASAFECDSCQALHLPHMQNFDGIFDAKIDLGGQRGALFRPRRR